MMILNMKQVNQNLQLDAIRTTRNGSLQLPKRREDSQIWTLKKRKMIVMKILWKLGTIFLVSLTIEAKLGAFQRRSPQDFSNDSPGFVYGFLG